MAEILRAISTDLDWPLALYWIAGSTTARAALPVDLGVGRDGARRRRRGVAGRGDLRGRARTIRRAARYQRCEPVWIEDLSAAGWRRGARLALAMAAGLVSSAAFPIADRGGRGRRHRALLLRRPPARRGDAAR